jgi:hypothetical protein
MSVKDKLLKLDTAILTVLLYPLIKLESKINKGQFNEKFGEPSSRHQAFAHIERWAWMVFGVITVTVYPLFGLIVIISYAMAVFADPIIWAYRSGRIVENEDFKMSAVVNSAILMMFTIGVIIGLILVRIC